MKIVFLILYLWHGNEAGHTWTYGGPAITITPMPNLKICEKVGSLTKKISESRVNASYSTGTFNTDIRLNETNFWCVEVDDK